MPKKSSLLLGAILLTSALLVSPLIFNSDALTRGSKLNVKLSGKSNTLQIDLEHKNKPINYVSSIYDSDLFAPERFMLKLLLDAQEQKDARALARSFTVHMRRAEPFLHFILSELKYRNMPVELIAIALVESGFKMRAQSHAGAHGPWQFTRATGMSYGLSYTEDYDEFYDFEKSTIAFLNYLSDLYLEFNNWDLAVIAYNQGEFGLKKIIRRERGFIDVDNPANYRDLPLSATARQYIRYFHAYAALLQYPELYGAKRPAVMNRPGFVRVVYGHKIKTLSQAANYAGVSLKEMQHLNAGFLHDELKYNMHILVPYHALERFNQALQN